MAFSALENIQTTFILLITGGKMGKTYNEIASNHLDLNLRPIFQSDGTDIAQIGLGSKQKGGNHDSQVAG